MANWSLLIATVELAGTAALGIWVWQGICTMKEEDTPFGYGHWPQCWLDFYYLITSEIDTLSGSLGTTHDMNDLFYY